MNLRLFSLMAVLYLPITLPGIAEGQMNTSDTDRLEGDYAEGNLIKKPDFQSDLDS